MKNERIDKQIFIEESIGEARNCEPIRVGVPFAPGELDHTDGAGVLDTEGKFVPLQATTLARWKDGSVKWALFDFTASVPGNSRVTYTLTRNINGAASDSPAISITPNEDSWQINTGAAVFYVDSQKFRPFIRIEQNGRDLLAQSGGACLLHLTDSCAITPVVEQIHTESPGPLRAILRIDGLFGTETETPPRFSCRLHFFAGTCRIMIEFTLRNPGSAHHPGGLWDLGNSGSLIFNGLSFSLPMAEGLVEEFSCSAECGMEPVQCHDLSSGLSVYQESSGGDNWRSPVHRDRTGEVPFRLRGYELRQGNRVEIHGERSTPLVWCGAGNKGTAAVLPLFWQEFPTALAVDRIGLNLELFPTRFPGLHELQGGEQKTSTIYLDFASSMTGLSWARAPLAAFAAPQVYRQSGILTDLPADGNDGSEYSDLIDRFIVDPQAIVRKREHIDEYGWRNYGELYADHEAVYHQGERPLISHYNNQYDPCAGMYRKFFATGNPLWGRLAADLAKHVLDIDIYHTDNDREEYNRGLFWHTDHYIDAGLSTHRSFSREHLLGKDPRFCGGGPGAEHCYTTGLMLHYFQTGDPAFRDAVINLADWVICSLAGPFTVLAATKRALRYIDRLRRSNSKNSPVFPRYPLSRGTGNAITACIDAHEVGGGSRFMNQAEEFIRGAVHPDDDIAARNLLNAEIAWSYTVLLVAVVKYLDKKRELGLTDAGFEYARASFLAYAEWMALHEYPYLEKPEQLEYPNETWAAQDLRKSVIFYHAARYAKQERRELFLERGKHFFTTAMQELLQHRSSSFTRPVALMLQNGWVGHCFDNNVSSVDCENVVIPTGTPTPRLSIGSVMQRIAGDLVNSAKVTSLRREMSWLKARLG